jgi:hypothetical protein
VLGKLHRSAYHLEKGLKGGSLSINLRFEATYDSHVINVDGHIKGESAL